MIKKPGFVYFLSNTYNNVLYIGVTNNILRRIAEHKAKKSKGFTSKYNCNKLVYIEIFDFISEAIAREKQLKSWKRRWKDELVNKENPEWNDLSDSIGLNDNLIEEVKAYHSKNEDQI